ncbi:VanZ family protein [Xylanimonas sp. McL0601]|uniref:VanZ family protein n=1 Tax=Xylanimonas sp. McL0601 TaxID=3414739 RepID=UPI003CF83583
MSRPVNERADAGRTAERVVLVLYLLVLAWVILLKMHTGDFGDLSGRRSLNLVPFAGTGELHGLGSQELAINVLAFIPLGVLVYLAARRRSFGRLLLPIVGAALAFEVVQYALGIGASDITDVLTNTTGGLIGLGIAWFGFRVLGARAQRWLLVGLVVVLLALAAGFVAWLQATGVRFRL